MPEFIKAFIGDDFSPEQVLKNVVGYFDFEAIITSAITGIGGVGSAIFNFFLALIAAIYFLLDKDRIKGFFSLMIEILTPEKVSGFVLKYSSKFCIYFKQYLFVQTIDGLILGVLIFITTLLFGSPYAIIFALIFFVTNYIPYFGAIFAAVVSIIVIAFTQSIQTAIFAGIVIIIIQQLESNVINPKLMSESFSIRPLLVVISVTIGGAYMGIVGMIIAIPITTVISEMIDAFIEYKRPKPVIEISKEDDTDENV
jgi:predicted PurR-regulated permease PerM